VEANSRIKAIVAEAALVVLIGFVVAGIGLAVNRLSLRSTFTPLKVGDRIGLKGGELGGATIILATSATCQYCKESQAFHQALIAKAHELGRKVLVLTSRTGEAPPETALALGPDDGTLHLDLTSIGVSGTPSVIALDPAARVVGLWVGKMNSAQEKTVLARLEGGHTLTRAGTGWAPGSGVGEELTESDATGRLSRFLVLDIRARTEADTGGARINIPVDELAARADLELPRDRDLLLDCSSLDSSLCETGREILVHNGITEIWLKDDGAVGASCRRSAIVE